jgi:hypothetical protein
MVVRIDRETAKRRHVRASTLVAISLAIAGLGWPVSGPAQQIVPGPPQPVPAADLPDAPRTTGVPASEAASIQLALLIASPQQIPASAASGDSTAGSIAGSVSNPNGDTIEGASVSLTRPDGSTPLPVQLTDPAGRFAFAAVPGGLYVLTVSASGFTTLLVKRTLMDGESAQLAPIVLSMSSVTSEVDVTVTEHELSLEQLHDEEQQRVFGFIPNFYVVYTPHAVPLSSAEKFHLAYKSLIDPVTIAISAGTAGVEEADKDYNGWGQGTEGFAKRFGADYADNVIGTMIGGAILPSVLHQDPRYFYKGTGSIRSRALYAIATSVICKGDNGHWQFDYSAVLGGLAAGGISNLYYPAANRNGIGLTFMNALTGTAGTAVGNLFQEFLVKRLTPKLPKYGAAGPAGQ